MTHTSKITIQNLSFSFPNKDPLFTNISLCLDNQKVGLVGRNGCGKSTLLKLIVGELMPTKGAIERHCNIGYLPQNLTQNSELSIADMLGVAKKITALQRIEAGSIDEKDYAIVGDDWAIMDNIDRILQQFGFYGFDLERNIASLSGGELTRLVLVKLLYQNPDYLLLDEPTNNLDSHSRQFLYHALVKWNKGLVIVSHDRQLLELMDTIIELSPLGSKFYGGNYSAYVKQKQMEYDALQRQLNDANKHLVKTKTTIQTSKEKLAQRVKHGKKKAIKRDLPKIMRDGGKERSEKTQKMLSIKASKQLSQAQQQLKRVKDSYEIIKDMSVNLATTKVPNNKLMVSIEHVFFSYTSASKRLINNFSLTITGPEKIALSGINGSGKSTLIKLILGQLQPSAGKIQLGTERIAYLDQHTELLQNNLTVLENFKRFNPSLTDEICRRYLAHFLFRNTDAEKAICQLSGGEKIRALLACILMSEHPPQLLILDEPTNHLDLSSTECIENILKSYQGAIIATSHDQIFLDNIGVKRVIYAPFMG